MTLSASKVASSICVDVASCCMIVCPLGSFKFVKVLSSGFTWCYLLRNVKECVFFTAWHNHPCILCLCVLSVAVVLLSGRTCRYRLWSCTARAHQDSETGEALGKSHRFSICLDMIWSWLSHRCFCLVLRKLSCQSQSFTSAFAASAHKWATQYRLSID